VKSFAYLGLVAMSLACHSRPPELDIPLVDQGRPPRTWDEQSSTIRMVETDHGLVTELYVDGEWLRNDAHFDPPPGYVEPPPILICGLGRPVPP
jgi:hypothetical protein